MKFFIKVLLFFSFAFSAPLTYEEILTKPSGIARDYYIYRFVSENNVTDQELLNLNNLIYKRSKSINKFFNKILAETSVFVDVCGGNILDQNTTCLSKLNVNRALKISTQDREKLIEKIKDELPQKAKMLKALNSHNPAIQLAKDFDLKDFIDFYRSTDKKDYFDVKFESKFINDLSKEDEFFNILKDTVMNRRQNIFRRNFLDIDTQNVFGKKAFFLALNAVTLGDEFLAKQFFIKARDSFEFQKDKDNANFWIYLISQNIKILDEIAQSDNINIYSLYAREILKKPDFKIEKIKPILKKVDFDTRDPFKWQELIQNSKKLNKENLLKLANQFYSEDSLFAYVYFMQRANNYKLNYYLLPKANSLKDIKPIRKSLIFAIARQESLFIPAIISSSYALGTMQFLPFLARDTARQLGIDNFDVDMMFDPEIAFKFANHHLDYLEKHLSHPLFIAYAYNAGIGYTRRLLKKGKLFKGGKFEPFLSMELINYPETRLYGKKVLANLVIYSKLNGSGIKISQLLKSLNQKSLIQKFQN